MLFGLTLVGFLMITIIGAKIPTKVLAGSLWGVFLTTAVLWVIIGAALPLEPSDLGCLDPICGIPGQLALVYLELGIAPPLLLEYFRRIRQNFVQSPGHNSGLWTGIGLLAAGVISLGGYYWTYLANVSLSIMTAVGVLWMSLRDVTEPKKAGEEQSGANLYFGQFLRDFVVLAFVGIFGFSILERDAYSYELLIPFGIGFIAFTIALHHGAKRWGVLPATFLLEGVVVGAVTLILGFAVYVLLTNEAAVLPVGLPPWMVGFAAAFLWHRINMLTGGTGMRIGERKRYLLKVPTYIIRKLLLMLFLTGLFLLMAINIDPDGTDSVLILDIGFVIGVIYFLAWVLDSPKRFLKKNPSNVA